MLPVPGGGGGRVLDQLAHPLLVAGLRGALRGGDGHQIQLVPAGRASRDLHADPVAQLLQGVQTRGERVVRRQAQLERLVGRVDRWRCENRPARIAALLAQLRRGPLKRPQRGAVDRCGVPARVPARALAHRMRTVGPRSGGRGPGREEQRSGDGDGGGARGGGHEGSGHAHAYGPPVVGSGR